MARGSSAAHKLVQELGRKHAEGEIDKWEFYEQVFDLHKQGKVSIAEIAELSGIPRDVVEDRWRYWQQLGSMSSNGRGSSAAHRSIPVPRRKGETVHVDAHGTRLIIKLVSPGNYYLRVDGTQRVRWANTADEVREEAAYFLEGGSLPPAGSGAGGRMASNAREISAAHQSNQSILGPMSSVEDAVEIALDQQARYSRRGRDIDPWVGWAPRGVQGLSAGWYVGSQGQLERAGAKDLRHVGGGSAHRPNAEGDILIEHGVVELPQGRGWLPVIWENGRLESSTFASRGYDLDEARERAEAMARKAASHYVGDWQVELRARPGVYVSGPRGGLELQRAVHRSNTGVRVTADIGVHRENPSGPGTSSRWDQVGERVYGRSGQVRTKRGKFTVYFRIDGRSGAYRVDMKSLPSMPWEAIDGGSGLKRLSDAKGLVSKWISAANAQETLSPRATAEISGPDIQRWMGENVGYFYERGTGEPQPTQLAEAAASRFGAEHFLDDDTHPIWDWAIIAFEEDGQYR